MSALVLLFLALHLMHAQEGSLIEVVKAESELAGMFTNLYSSEYPGSKDSLNMQILTVFSQALAIPVSFDFNWDKLNMIGKLLSDDRALKVFTWYLETGPGEFSYYGFIQLQDSKKENVFPLEDHYKGNAHKEVLKQTTEDWHGKLYYQLLTNTYKRDTYYTLLGMDFNTPLSRIKTIEVLGLQRGKPQFETGLFFDGKKYKDRVVFEYSAQVSMSLHFNPSMQEIVFDHLIPFQPIYFGDFRFYGPDGSFDAFQFTDGRWIFSEDVDARNF